MKAAVLKSLVLRYLFGKGLTRQAALRRIRGGILGIALSLVPLVLVYEVASGMVEGISIRLLETWSYHLQLDSPSYGSIEEMRSRVSALKEKGLVQNAWVELQGLGLLKGPEGSSGITVRAMEADYYDQDPGFRTYLEVKAGAFDLSGQDAIVLGDALAKDLGAVLGGKVRMLTYGSDDWGSLPRISTFTVRGIVSSGYQDLDKLWAFVSLERGARVLAPGSTRGFIGVKIPDPYQIPNALVHRPGLDYETWTESMRAVTGKSWLAYSWYDMQAPQYEHFATTKNLLVLIMVLIVLVASFNIFSTMVLIVVEKQLDIAMLRSFGAGSSEIQALFLIMGTLTGALGAVFGLGAGALASLWVNELLMGLEWILNLVMFASNGGSIKLLNPEFYLERIPIRIHGFDLALTGVLTLVLSMIASYLPARRAARLAPSEILRKV